MRRRLSPNSSRWIDTRIDSRQVGRHTWSHLSPNRPNLWKTNPSPMSFLDYAVIAGYLAAITAFGSWFARFQKTTRDYFLTDRSIPWWAVCFTIVATETSTLSFIGVPASAFAGNMTFLQLALGYVIG